MQKARRLPPTWLMGLTNVPFGLTGGFCAVIIPQLLAAHGIPAGHVAAIAAAILSPGFWIFAVSPCSMLAQPSHLCTHLRIVHRRRRRPYSRECGPPGPR